MEFARGLISQIVEAFARSARANSIERDAQIRAVYWSAGATVAMAIFAFVSLGVGIAQWIIQSRTLDEMKGQQRAWLAPGDIEFKSLGNNNYELSIEAENLGMTAGTNMGFFLEVPKVLALQPGDISNFRAGENTACDRVERGNDGFGVVMYPKMPRHLYAAMTNYSVGPNETVVIKGCMVYKSLGETRRSPFCWFTLPENKPLEERRSRYCDQGNEPT